MKMARKNCGGVCSITTATGYNVEGPDSDGDVSISLDCDGYTTFEIVYLSRQDLIDMLALYGLDEVPK